MSALAGDRVPSSINGFQPCDPHAGPRTKHGHGGFCRSIADVGANAQGIFGAEVVVAAAANFGDGVSQLAAQVLASPEHGGADTVRGTDAVFALDADGEIRERAAPTATSRCWRFVDPVVLSAAWRNSEPVCHRSLTGFSRARMTACARLLGQSGRTLPIGLGRVPMCCDTTSLCDPSNGGLPASIS